MKKTFYVKGMHCKSCEILIHETLKKLAGITDIQLSPKEKKLTLSINPEKVSETQIHEVLNEAGYSLSEKTFSLPFITQEKKVWRDFLISVGIILGGYYLWREISHTQGGRSFSQYTGFRGMIIVGLIAGFSTCMAVVGGLLATFVTKRSHTTNIVIPQTWFHLGRLLIYSIVGGILGGVGSILALNTTIYATIFGIVGMIMVVYGLQSTGIFPILEKVPLGVPSSWFLSTQKKIRKTHFHSEGFWLGVTTILLPCGFTMIAMTSAISTGNMRGGVATMSGFAIGTLPGLLGIGIISSRIQHRGGLFSRLLGAILVGFGLYNLSLSYENVVAIQTRNNQSITTDAENISQEITITQDDGYSPTNQTIKPGRIKLYVDSKNSYNCSVAFTIPSKGIKSTLKPGINTFEFIANPGETIVFMCSMGMYKGKIIVR